MRTKGKVFDAIFPPEEAIAVKFKANLYEAILKAAKRYKPSALELILHEPQPRISELLNGKLGQKSLEKLLGYAGRLGIEHRGKFPQVHKNVPERVLEMVRDYGRLRIASGGADFSAPFYLRGGPLPRHPRLE